MVNSYHCFKGAWCPPHVINVKFSHHHAMTLSPRQRHLHFSPPFLQADIPFVLSTSHNLLGVSERKNFKCIALTRQNTTEYLVLNNRINSPSQDTTALQSNIFSNWNTSFTGHKCLRSNFALQNHYQHYQYHFTLNSNTFSSSVPTFESQIFHMVQ